MIGVKRVTLLLCLASASPAWTAECEPSVAMLQPDLAKHPYVRPQAASCNAAQDQQPRTMWKLIEGATSAWPYQYAGQCTPSKGGAYQSYGCLAPEGCAIFVGKDKLRIHLRKGDLACGGMEP
jgi:hypothetical protein